MTRRSRRAWIAAATSAVLGAALGGLALYERPGGDCTVEALAWRV